MAPQKGNHPPHAMDGGAPIRAPPNITNPNPSHHRLHLKLIDPKTKTVRDDVFKVTFG